MILERLFDENMEYKIYDSLGRSHPNDDTGYYTLLRAFQHHIRGEYGERDKTLEGASKEHVKFRHDKLTSIHSKDNSNERNSREPRENS